VGEHAGDLQIKLESHLPKTAPVGSATAIFCYGHCFHRRLKIERLELIAGGVPEAVAARAMPRRDLFDWLRASGADPTGASYRSGFWATVPIPAQRSPGPFAIEAAVRLDNGECHRVALGAIEIVTSPTPPNATVVAPGTIAVCMATFEPDPELFAVQVRSLKTQTDDRWVCVISDGGSSDDTLARIADVIGTDSRFELSRSPQRLAPYHNFERALRLAPAAAELLAPCDQDDDWYPDKLAALRGALGDAQLAFCDQRLIDRGGRVLRDSLWQGRRNDHANLASLLVANSIPGAAMLFRRGVAELALPFPEAPGVPYHDHWLALVALSCGRVAYVSRPLYDYVQHTGAVSGNLIEPADRTRAGRVPLRGSRGWRSAYFGGYVMREAFALTLLLRCGAMLTQRKRRALRWFAAAGRSPWAFAWLAGRPLRRLAGRDETLGGEVALAAGIAWRWLLTLAVAGARRPGRRAYDASFPDPPSFEQPRLRRWRAGA
jgi:glycosyltransferase involved in cell wall biosynthesis